MLATPACMLLWALLALPLAASAAAAAAPTSPSTAAARQPTSSRRPVRFFIDEGFFLQGDTEILRAFIAASAGRLEVSGESSAAFLSVKGYYVPDTWDVYWSTRAACLKALPHMKPGQLANCLPGAQAMALKRDFVSTWQQAYSEAAFRFIPRSYLLPHQYWLWRSHLLTSGSPPEALWVLKADVHRGKGVAVVPQQTALAQALAHKAGQDAAAAAAGAAAGDDSAIYHNILVQRYLQPQMVIAGRSSYLRVWLLVTSISPLRAYLFRGGFAIFGKQKQQQGSNATAAAAAGNSSSSSSSDSLIVNLWIQDRNSSSIWSLQQLERYLSDHPEQVLPLPADHGKEQQQQQQQPGNSSSGAGTRRTFADAWCDMQASAALVLAAALPAMRAAAAGASAPPTGLFEQFGLDFVLDAHLRPWMLEVNAGPSMARRNKGKCVGDKATASCQLKKGSSNSSSKTSNSTGAAAAAAAAGQSDEGFDLQKEAFVHDMLAVLGLPVDAPPPATKAAGDTQQAVGSDGLGLLQQAAEFAAAAANSSSRSQPEHHRSLLLQDEPEQQVGGWWQQQQLAWQRRLQQRRHRLAARHRHHRRHHRARAAAISAAAAAAGAADAADSTDAAPAAVVVPGGQAGQQPASTAPAQNREQLPPQLAKLLCDTSTSTTSSSSSSAAPSQAFACISCLTAADLAAITAAELELQRAGLFSPVADLIPAHQLNSRAATGTTSSAATGGGAASRQPKAAASDNGPSLVADAAEKELLQQERTVWDKLHHTWQILSGHGLPVKSLGVMKHYTAATRLPAAQALQLDRQDYVTSAWLRLRRQLPCTAAAADDAAGGQVFGGSGDASAAAAGGAGGGKASRACMLERLEALVHRCQLEK